MNFQAKIKGGQLIFENRKWFDFQIAKFTDGPISITIERKRTKRSEQQNNYYHKCIDIICEYTGYTHDEQCAIFKQLYLPQKKTWRGRPVQITKSTTELSKSEFWTYMDLIIREAAEMRIELPVPDDFYKSEPIKK